MSNIEKYKPYKLLAIELLATNPALSQKDIAKKVGVESRTIRYWMADPLFVDAFYKRYMEVAGVDLPNVIAAMFEEAKMGNVQAGRRILEHFGKLDNSVKIQIESPWEKFMKVDADDAEFIDMDDETKGVLDKVAEAISVDSLSLPERDSSNDYPRKRMEDEQKRVDNLSFKAVKKKVVAKKQQSRYLVRKQAKEVGLDLLPPGRHSRGTRIRWMKKLDEMIKEAEKGNN